MTRYRTIVADPAVGLEKEATRVMDEYPPDVTASADHDARLAVARAYAGWKLGDPGWADTFIAAYLCPEQCADRLKAERARFEKADA